jgi:hypothetical protein
MQDLENIANRKGLDSTTVLLLLLTFAEFKRIRHISLQESLIPELLLLQRQSISNEFSKIIDTLYQELETGVTFDTPPQFSLAPPTTYVCIPSFKD